MKVLMTGATGFIGSHTAVELLAEQDTLVSMERITPRPSTLGVFRSSIFPLYHDFQAALPDRILNQLQDVDCIVHCGAEVHGLRSLDNPELFIRSNVVGTYNLLEAARKIKGLKKFIYVSSAEAVGGCPAPTVLTEDAALRPSNPYAAAKASAELLCRSYRESFGVPTLVVRTMNVFGEQQDASKFVPATIKKILAGEFVTIHIGPDGQSGSRQWLPVEECARAVRFLSRFGLVGETYHVVGPQKSNQDMATLIAQSLHSPLIQHVAVPSKAHDMRYCVADTKLSSQTYDSSEKNFLEALDSTVKAYQNNRGWLQ